MVSRILLKCAHYSINFEFLVRTPMIALCIYWKVNSDNLDEERLQWEIGVPICQGKTLTNESISKINKEISLPDKWTASAASLTK